MGIEAAAARPERLLLQRWLKRSLAGERLLDPPRPLANADTRGGLLHGEARRSACSKRSRAVGALGDQTTGPWMMTASRVMPLGAGGCPPRTPGRGTQ